MNTLKKLLEHLIPGLFTILGILLIGIAIFKKEYIEYAIEWVKNTVEFLGYWNYPIIFVSSFIESFPFLGSFLPGTNILLVVGGFFGNKDTIQFIYVILVAGMGAILGNTLSYILGKKFGIQFFIKYGIYIGIGKTEIDYMKGSIDKWGLIAIILGKFHTLTRTIVPFIAGTVDMKIKTFMIYNCIGSFIRASTVIVLGVFFVTYYEIILKYLSIIVSMLFLGIFLYLYLFKRSLLQKYIDDKNKEIEELIQQYHSSTLQK